MFQKLRSLKGTFCYDDREMPILEHLTSFRKAVIRAAIALLIGVGVCLPFADHLITILRAPAEPYIERSAVEVLKDSSLKFRIPADSLMDEFVVVDAEGQRYYDLKAELMAPSSVQSKEGVIRLQFSEPAAAIKMWLTVSFFGGILLSLPALVFIIGSFVLPGVRDVERKVLGRISLFSGGLFLLGIAMSYKITLPLALGMMLKIGGSLGGESIWFYNKYIAFALQLLLGFGVAFQLPVVILVLGKMGLVNSTQLRKKRRHVIVGLLILSMLLTPPDVMTQMLMAGPLILLYEFCIWVLYFSGNREVSSVAESPEEELKEDENEQASTEPDAEGKVGKKNLTEE